MYRAALPDTIDVISYFINEKMRIARSFSKLKIRSCSVIIVHIVRKNK
jgi:hypothetical protein